jgi:hypothetical protein
MRRRVSRGNRALLVIMTAIIAVFWSAIALAALPPPVLQSPHRGQKVHKGAITLIVKVTMPGVTQVNVQIVPKRHSTRGGILAVCVDEPCDTGLATRWQGHPGLWIYKANRTRYNALHYWADTPGKYYWQADELGFNCARLPACEAYSQIWTFYVVR